MLFRVAISGLRAASQDLSVIGNNVANANTAGFKQSRAEFADVYAVSNVGSTSSPGSGVNLGRIAQTFSQGNISFTDNGLDLAISGQGFFVLNDAGTTVYS
jgi:flagellar hook protein FlgE